MTAPAVIGSAAGEPGLVVGAAVLRGGRVLAARRRHAPRATRRWEFPGGKVEAGETAESALARECREELGIAVSVTGRLPGEELLPAGRRLRVLVARLAPGSAEPASGADHDALRWVGPEELEQVPWLAADRAFLPAVRDRLLDGEPLPGGNVGGAVRVGDTVRRPTGPWTPAVHALLDHLRRAGLDGVPRVCGTDARGREIVSYLPGRTVGDAAGSDWPDWVFSDPLLAQVGRWLGRYHQAVRSFRPPGPLRWRGGRRVAREGELVCHNDVAPYNVVVDGDGDLAGVLDWDVAGPGHPVDDLAFAAWNFVPLFRESPAPTCARRLRLLAAAYASGPAGLPDRPDAAEILVAVPGRIRRAVDTIRAGADGGDAGLRHLVEIGEVAATEDRLRRFLVRKDSLTRALAGEPPAP